MSKRIPSKYERKYKQVAKATLDRVNDLLRGYPVAMISNDDIIVAKNHKVADSTTRPLLDETSEKFIRKIRNTKRNIRSFESRAIALNFLNHYLSGKDGKLPSDTLVSNLQVLLHRQFNRGVDFERRRSLIKAKKRK